MIVPFGLTDAEVASREQRAINEAEYKEIAQRMIDNYIDVQGFDGNFPTWLIRQEIGACNNNKTVKGVYAALTVLLGRDADNNTNDQQVEAQARWDREQAHIQLEGEVAMMALDFFHARGTTSSLKVDQGGQ